MAKIVFGREIVQDYAQHTPGEREVVDWDRLVDGRKVTHRNVPIVYLREVTAADYEARYPGKSPHPDSRYFWEVSMD